VAGAFPAVVSAAVAAEASDELLYSAQPSSAYQENQHLVVRVVPSGQRIAFKLSSIQNRNEVESQLPRHPRPSSHERRVLNFHLRRGTNSRLFEELRRKYPDYQP
jgi:hypothetical protein